MLCPFLLIGSSLPCTGITTQFFYLPFSFWALEADPAASDTIHFDLLLRHLIKFVLLCTNLVHHMLCLAVLFCLSQLSLFSTYLKLFSTTDYLRFSFPNSCRVTFTLLLFFFGGGCFSLSYPSLKISHTP